MTFDYLCLMMPDWKIMSVFLWLMWWGMAFEVLGSERLPRGLKESVHKTQA